MIVCHCLRITDADIHTKGLCKAGSCCGGCIPAILDILKEQINKTKWIKTGIREIDNLMDRRTKVDLTLDEVGMEMYQDDEELVWELDLPANSVVLRLPKEDLEHLIDRLSDELDRYALDYSAGAEKPFELPEGTDCIELIPDAGVTLYEELEDRSLEDFVNYNYD